jgi:hypothetical protein
MVNLSAVEVTSVERVFLPTYSLKPLEKERLKVA